VIDFPDKERNWHLQYSALAFSPTVSGKPHERPEFFFKTAGYSGASRYQRPTPESCISHAGN
jgi:hypothetical protein